MSAHAIIGPSLSELYPPFAEKLRQYNRLLARDPDKAEALFAEAQVMAKAFRAGLECGVRK